MNRREKRLLALFLILMSGYLLPFEVAPFVLARFDDQWRSLEQVRDGIERYDRLLSRESYWRGQLAQAREQRERLDAALLPGESRNLVSARLQGLLRGLAERAGVSITSMDLPEYVGTGSWLLVTQMMNIESDSAGVSALIDQIQHSGYKLSVVSLDVRGGHQGRLRGSLKVTGFGRQGVALHE